MMEEPNPKPTEASGSPPEDLRKTCGSLRKPPEASGNFAAVPCRFQKK